MPASGNPQWQTGDVITATKLNNIETALTNSATKPVPLSEIDPAAMTSPGGTEANRLALTNASGYVGRAIDADTVDGLHASAFAKIASGSYAGDGALDRVITVGFTPKVVFVFGNDVYDYVGFGINLQGVFGIGRGALGGGIAPTNDERWRPTIVTGGFRVDGGGTDVVNLNASTGIVYYWVAIG